jgi:tetratricopeptide (TPR) repeat protein
MLHPRDRFGRFELVELIGRGGMGEVWRAQDLQLGRSVAIKVLPERLATDPDSIGRFEREARALAALNHPNVAQIYEVGETELPAGPAGDRPGLVRYLVMELVEGTSLADRIKAEPLSTAETVVIGGQIARAVLAAHERGVIHRDLKPANVMLTPKGEAKVLDFGLARILARRSARAEHDITEKLSSSGVVVGTAAYMAPEQIRGLECDERCDVWAIGCTLAEMLSGSRLFTGATLPEIAGNVLAGKAQWGTLPKRTPRALRALLRRCVALERGDRPGMAEVHRELETIETSAPRRWQSIRFWVAATLVVASLAVAGAVLWRLRTSAPELAAWKGDLPVAVRPIRWLSTAKDGSSGSLAEGALVLALTNRSGVKVVAAGREAVRVQPDADLVGDQIRLRATCSDARSRAVVGQVERAVARPLSEVALREWAEAVADLVVLESIARNLAADDVLQGYLVRKTKVLAAAQAFRDALERFTRTRYKDAEPLLKRALEADPAFWPAHLFIARTYKATSRFREWQGHLAEARRLVPTPDARDNATIESIEALLQEDNQRALEAFERALKLFPGSGFLLHNTGLAYRQQDRAERAIPLYEEELEKGWQPDWSPAREELANALLLVGRLEDTIKVCGDGEERFPTRHKYPYFAACALEQLGRHEEAREALRRAIRKRLDFGSPDRLEAQKLTQYWASLLRWDEERRRQWQGVLDESERRLREAPTDEYLLQSRAEALIGLGRFAEARAIVGPLAERDGIDPYVLIDLARAALGERDDAASRAALERAGAAWRRGGVPALGTLANNNAATWALVGDANQAMDWLLRGRDLYGVDRLDLAMDPELDLLRNQGLLKQLPPRR